MNNKFKMRNGEIEFLRFIFCMYIAGFHTYLFRMKPSTIFPAGYIAVEFFFIVSGYLLAIYVETQRKVNTNLDLATDTVKFIKKKIIAIYPYYCVAFFTCFIIKCATSSITSPKQIALFFTGSIPELFFVNMSGVNIQGINSPTWYISIMLLVMAFIYPIARKWWDMFSKVIAPLAVILIFGWMSQNIEEIGKPSILAGFTYRGTYRALAGILLGIVVYHLSKNLKNVSLRLYQRIIITIIQTCLFTVIMYYIMKPMSNKQYDFIIVYLIALLVALAFSGQSLYGKILNNKFIIYLGKLSMTIYLIHYSMILLFMQYHIKNATHINYYIYLSIYLVVVIIAGIILLTVVDWVKILCKKQGSRNR